MVKKEKEYFSLTEVMEMVDLKPRMVKYRMLDVKEKYRNNKNLLFKDNRNWNIHKSIVFEFDRRRITKQEEKNRYRTFTTVSPWGEYCVESIVEVAKDIFAELRRSHSNVHIFYVVEIGENENWCHLHFTSNLSMNYSKLLERASRNLLLANVEVRRITNERNLSDYLKKEVMAAGYLGDMLPKGTFLNLSTPVQAGRVLSSK